MKFKVTDEAVEKFIGNQLRVGVIAAAALVFAGGVDYIIRFGSALPDYRFFRGEPSDLRSVHGIIMDALTFRSRGLIQLGILVLIATPVARVAFSIFAFLLERDFLYVAVTVLVLGVLLYSFVGGGL